MMGLRGRPKGLTSIQLSAFAAGAVCLSGWGALSLSGLSVGASGPCTPYDPTKLAAGVYKNINTTDGCDQAAGNALYPISGFIAGSGLTANAKYTVYDIYQTLPDKDAQVYYGAYTLGLVPTVGTATDGAYSVASGASTYPSLPAAPTGTLPTVTTDASGNFAAAYSLTVQNAPAVDMVSSRNDLWLVMDGSDAGHVATISVKPPVLPLPSPTPTPCSESSSSSSATSTSTSTESCTTSSSSTSTQTSSSTTTETSSSTSTETSSSTSTETSSSTSTETSSSTSTGTSSSTSTETSSTTTGSVSGSSTSSTESSSTTSLVSLPSPTPAGTVLGTSSSSSTSGGGVGGITTPNTGAGANSTLSTALLGFGLSFLVAGGMLGRRRKS